MKNNRLIVILGMHHSGTSATSAITRGLQALGVDLGDSLRSPIEGYNAKGFGGDLDFNALNIKILSALETDWHYLAPIESHDIKALYKSGYFVQAVELLRSKIGSSPLFAYKDPSAAKLLPFWKAVFSHCQLDVSYVLVVRHPLSVAVALAERDGFDAEKSYLLWLGYVIASLSATAGDKRVLVDNDHLMQSPERELHRIAKCLDLEIDPIELQSYQSEFLDQGLRPTVYDLNDLSLDPACTPIVRDVYATMQDLATDKTRIDDPALQNEIRNWAATFECLKSPLALADKLYIQKVQAITVRDKQIAALTRSMEERDGQITRLSNSIVEMRKSLSWRITSPVRFVLSFGRRVLRKLFALPRMVRKGEGLWATLLLKRIQAQRTKITISREAKLSIVPCYIDPKLDMVNGVVSTKVSIAIHMHLYHPEMLNELALYLKSIPVPYDLYISAPETCDPSVISAELKAVLSMTGKIVVEPVPNRGGDLAPFIIQFGNRLSQYEIIAHVHAKNSPHNSDLADWNKDILDLLMGPHGSSGGYVAHVIGLLQSTAKVVYPEGSTQFIKDRTGWSDNYELAKQLLEKYTKLSIDDFPLVDFPEGSMFWARAECLKEYLALPLDWSDFPAEPIPADGTLAHALERLILVFASKHKGQCVRLHKGDSIQDYRHYEEQRDYSPSIIHGDIKVLSYYLPQFHPIPENDLWHGKGFTEWSKVRAANPLFEGHYQQHIPHPDIGYYLLDSPDVLKRQADLMRQAGVYGQVFYHYWFSGKLILEEPAKLLLDNPDIHMPFCFCWANENWTRRWDGNEKEILLGQNYSAEDARDFINYLIPFFKDPRYIKVADRPMLYVYRPTSIPNSHEYLDIWEKECARFGIKRPYVVAVLTRGANYPGEFGMDAGVERVFHDWTAGAVPDIKGSLRPYRTFNGSVLPYDQVADLYAGQTDAKDYTYFRSLVPTWDNTARYGSEAYLLHGSTPHRFQEWLESIITYEKSTLPADRRFVLVNAWNEWAEGAHLEPDTRFGYSYLNSIGRALAGIPYAADLNPNCLIPPGLRIHLYFPEFVLEQLRSDSNLKKRFIFSLSRSTIFKACLVSCDSFEIFEGNAQHVNVGREGALNADFILQFRRVAFFAPTVIEKMIQSACHSPRSVVISNAYDSNAPLIKVTANGSVESFVAYDAPLLLIPTATAEYGYKNFKMRTDAHSFVTYPAVQNVEKLPTVTTIIRFHKSADINTLKNALYCLAAMRECEVVPLIAAQDLNEQQTAALEAVLNDILWSGGAVPIIHHYHSPTGDGDLRTIMLNESLKQVKSRYAAFLDYDDLLMPHAYSWLIGRLNQTGKAVSFGRVYVSSYDGSTGQIMERKRDFEVGYSYAEFLRLNHAPLHSFMLDLKQLDLSGIVYFENQRYMEDYFLTLQLFTRDNVDWGSLAENVYIGDYIHSVDRSHTLAISDKKMREVILSSSEYMLCEQRICDLRKSLCRSATAKHGRSSA